GRWAPAGAARVAGVLGSPRREWLSPAVCSAAYRALRLEWLFCAFDVPPGRAAEAVAGARFLGIEGLSVTMPHKADVIPALERLTPVAAALRAVNTIVRLGAELVGDNTDGG